MESYTEKQQAYKHTQNRIKNQQFKCYSEPQPWRSQAVEGNHSNCVNRNQSMPPSETARHSVNETFLFFFNTLHSKNRSFFCFSLFFARLRSLSIALYGDLQTYTFSSRIVFNFSSLLP